MDRLAALEHEARRGEVVVSQSALAQCGDDLHVSEWRDAGLEPAAVVAGLRGLVEAAPWPPDVAVDDEQARAWVLPPVYERLRYAAFGAPTAHEDETARALSAALDLRAPPAELAYVRRLQVGLSRGLMRAGDYGGATRRTYGVIGTDVNVAARLMTEARPGQILATQRIVDGLGNGFEFQELPEPIRLNGVAERLRVFETLDRRRQPAIAHARVRPVVTLIGRADERADLIGRLRVLRDRQGSIIIEGEAGIGKSRLVQDPLEQAGSENLLSLLGAGDAIEQSTIYHAWRPVFSQVLDLDALPDDLQARRAHVLSYLDAVAQHDAGEPDPVRHAPLLTAVLPLDLPDNDSTSTLVGRDRAEATRDLLVRMLRRAPHRW